ncbi:hypothetical protein JCM8097_006087 [Rhodosporidiobolus ruineniae]
MVQPSAPVGPSLAYSDKALKYVDLLAAHGDHSPQHRLSQLRQLILLESLPDGEEGAQLRPAIWRLLLQLHVLPPGSTGNVHPLLDAESYQNLISRDASPMFSKIRNDTFRTLATDKEFMDKVGEERLVRCLEAFVWRQLDSAEHGPETPIDPAVPYVQGQNVLAAPFLYVLPSQLEAFACFTTFVENQVPRYVSPTLVGVHDGLQLVDLCLLTLDPALHAHLASFNLSAEIYAFPSILTFCAATPPLREVLELWDFLLSWGVGLNVLCVVAQLWGMKGELMESKTPMKLLRTFPPLKSREIIPLVVQFIGDLPPALYEACIRHPWDDSLKLAELVCTAQTTQHTSSVMGLKFKGDKLAPKKKKSSSSKALASTREDSDAHLEGWMVAPSPSLLLGPSYLTLPSTSLTPPLCVAINPTTGKVYPFVLPTSSAAAASSSSSSAAHLASLDPDELEALVDPSSLSSSSTSSDPTSEGPSDVHHVWVCTRIPDTLDKVTFRSGSGKFLAADEYGAVTADREARGTQEEWTVEEAAGGEKGRFAVKSSYGKYLSVDVVAGGKIELRADEANEGETERWKVLMQGEFVGKARKQDLERRGIKTRPDNGLTIVTDLAGAEVDAIKKYHHHAKGSDLVGSADDVRALKRAKKEGKLAEAMLDRRAKLKSDRYC